VSLIKTELAMNEEKEIYLLTTDGYRESLFLERYATSYEEVEKIARICITDIYGIQQEEITSVLVDRIGKKVLFKLDDSRDFYEYTFYFIVIKPIQSYDRT
jgi:hypothetical protein